MDQPSTTDLPDFCLTGSKDPPVPLEVSDGLLPQEKVSAQLFNYLNNKSGLWIRWIAEGVLRRSSLTNKAPIVATSDRNGLVRSYLTAEGYVGGPVIQTCELWRTGVSVGNNTRVSENFVATISGGTVTLNSATSISPKMGTPFVDLGLTIGFANRNAGVVTSGLNTAHIIGNLPDTVVVIEGYLCRTNASQSVAAYFGMHSFNYKTNFSGSDDTETLSHDFVHFRSSYNAPETDTTWKCVVGNSTGKTVVDSGVSSATMSEFSHFRIEYHGDNSALGGDNGNEPVARFFIGGVMVAEISTNRVPKNKSMGVGALFGTWAGPQFTSKFLVGPIKMAWNCVANATPPV